MAELDELGIIELASSRTDAVRGPARPGYPQALLALPVRVSPHPGMAGLGRWDHGLLLRSRGLREIASGPQLEQPGGKHADFAGNGEGSIEPLRLPRARLLMSQRPKLGILIGEVVTRLAKG
eukprot:5306213-Pyramimonas_sp.AAC.1